MYKKLIISLLGLFGLFFHSYAQVNSANKTDLMIIQQVAQENSAQNLIENNQSSVFLNQIGQLNNASINSTAKFSSYLINQSGINNRIYQYKIASDLNERMDQFGDNNRVFEIANNFVDKTNSIINQQGSNLRIEKYGNNDIGANMEINMKGNFRTLIVRNYQ